MEIATKSATQRIQKTGRRIREPAGSRVNDMEIGPEAVKPLLEACPGIRILLCSSLGSTPELKKQALLMGANDGIGKKRTKNGLLINGRQIADRVLKLLSTE
jgi:hypothetical protein